MNAFHNDGPHRISNGIGKKRQRRMYIVGKVMSCRGGDSDVESSYQPANSVRPRPSLVVEFDTNFGYERHRNVDNDQIINTIESQAGPALSLSVDTSQCLHHANATTILIQNPDSLNATNNFPSHATPTLPLTTLWTLIAQSALLLPSLLITRRILNSTSNAVVDYFRGRYLRTTFTRLERAYLRYYEFPAATRAMFRVASQIGILMSLNWAVRWWLYMVVRTGGEDVTLSTFIDARLPLEVDLDFKVDCLPCRRVGRGGVPWLCGVVWIGSVVGAGHACAMALSKWGGPLRLQAASANQQPQKPTHVLSWIIHHPIQWIRGLDEWKHFSSLGIRKNKSDRTGRRRKWRAINPDPLLFPATWMPLRWLQIYAIAKAFATDPTQYRWCSPEKQTATIHHLMKLYLVQYSLGDEWSRVFLGEYRVGLGILVVSCYFVALAWMVFTTFTLNVGASVLLIPSLLAAIISGFMNMSIFWNRMGTREQKKALEAMGWSNAK